MLSDAEVDFGTSMDEALRERETVLLAHGRGFWESGALVDQLTHEEVTQTRGHVMTKE